MLSYFQRKRMLSFKLYVLERQSFLLALVEIFWKQRKYPEFCVHIIPFQSEKFIDGKNNKAKSVREARYSMMQIMTLKATT